jgi:iron(III) transport system substrate-binding protein
MNPSEARTKLIAPSAPAARSLLGLVALFLFVANAHAQPRGNWKEEWDSVVAKAKQEGTVVVWSTPGELLRRAITEGFKKAFPGINVEYTGAPGGQLATKLAAEREGGVYNLDVLVTGADTHSIRVKPLKALDPIRPALLLPEVTDTKYWRDNRLEFIDAEKQNVVAFVNQTSPVAGYNLKQVKPEEISRLNDLLAPKWKERIVISDPTTPGAAQSWFHWVWNTLGPEKATDFFKRLRAQADSISRDWRRELEWVAQGKHDILIAPGLTVAYQLLSEGVQFGMLWEFQDAGTWITVAAGSVSMINRAPHPNAAKVFINWLLSRDGQTTWSKTLNMVSRRLDVPTDHIPAGAIPRAGGKYWLSYQEQVIVMSPEETRTLKEIFGR